MKNKITYLTLFILIGLIGLLTTGCQGATKSFGGTTTIHLEPNLKLEEITWKDDSLWYLTKPMISTDIVETHTFQQQSEWGVFEGKVIVIESRASEEDINEYHIWNKWYSMSWDDYLWYKQNGYSLEDVLNGNVDYTNYQTEDAID